MKSVTKPLRVAISGARGIGQIHARIFQSLGVDVCAVLGSSQETAMSAAKQLEESFGIKAKPFHRLEELFKESEPDALSICTPAQFHYDAILASLNQNIPVFCEKPMLWKDGINIEEVEEKLNKIDRHPNRKIFVNTSNANFMDRVLESIGPLKDIHRFYCKFYSQGSHQKREIGIDMLPHGISLLLRLFGPRDITDLSENIKEHNYTCTFNYGDCTVHFDFQELADGPKEFIIGINERTFTRIQEGFGTTYRVYLNDSQTGENIPCEDPFAAYIKNFLKYCENDVDKKDDEFEEAAANVRLMSEILLRKN